MQLARVEELALLPGHAPGGLGHIQLLMLFPAQGQVLIRVAAIKNSRSMFILQYLLIHNGTATVGKLVTTDRKTTI